MAMSCRSSALAHTLNVFPVPSRQVPSVPTRLEGLRVRPVPSPVPLAPRTSPSPLPHLMMAPSPSSPTKRVRSRSRSVGRGDHRCVFHSNSPRYIRTTHGPSTRPARCAPLPRGRSLRRWKMRANHTSSWSGPSRASGRTSNARHVLHGGGKSKAKLCVPACCSSVRARTGVVCRPPLTHHGVHYTRIHVRTWHQAPHYWSDMKDGFNLKGLATTVFLFFACLAPAVAFGGLMGKVTDGHVRTYLGRKEGSRACGQRAAMDRSTGRARLTARPSVRPYTHTYIHTYRSGPWRCSWPQRTTASPTRSSRANR